MAAAAGGGRLDHGGSISGSSEGVTGMQVSEMLTAAKSLAERESKEIEAGYVPRRIVRDLLSAKLRTLRKAHVKTWIAQQGQPAKWTSDDLRHSLRSSEVASLPKPKSFKFLPLRKLQRALPELVKKAWAQTEDEQRALLLGGAQ